MTGQLRPQPTEVMARKIKARRGEIAAARPAGLELSWGGVTRMESPPPCRLSAPLTIAPGHASPDHPGAGSFEFSAEQSLQDNK